MGIGNYFLNRTSSTQKIRVRIDKWDYIKVKTFCTSKDYQNQDTTIEWEKIFASLMDKGLISRIYKELKKI
jgi:hypothetical protein